LRLTNLENYLLSRPFRVRLTHGVSDEGTGRTRPIAVARPEENLFNIFWMFTMPIAICELCKNCTQVKDSHIIPASMHKVLKDNNGKNIKFSLPGDLRMKNQRDLKEYMLCEDCEQRFSKFEQSVDILKPLWHNTNEGRRKYVIPAKSTNSILQLVQSIFWRASVSSTLSNFKLCENDEEELRLALLSGFPVKLPRFPVRLDFFTYLREIGSSKMMHSPFMHDIFPGSKYSTFVSLGIIFSMQTPQENDLFDLHPYLIAEEDYTISAAPYLVESWCVGVLGEAQKIGQAYGQI